MRGIYRNCKGISCNIIFANIRLRKIPKFKFRQLSTHQWKEWPMFENEGQQYHTLGSGLHWALQAYHDITAGDLGYIVLVRSAGGAEVRVTFPHSQETWTLLRGTLRLAPDKTDNCCNQWLLVCFGTILFHASFYRGLNFLSSSKKISFFCIFLWVSVCWPLLCLCRPFYSFWGMSGFEPREMP